MNDSSETNDVQEAQPETQSENISPRGITSIQGLETSTDGTQQPSQDIPQSQNSSMQDNDTVPDPADRLLTRATYFEAKEGDRNSEDGMVEGNYDLHPIIEEDKENKPGSLKWNPHGRGERGG